MAKILEQPRFKCALGAMQTVQSIDRVVPILHSSPGCSQKLGEGIGTSGYYSSHIFPNSNLGESDIVFGGEKKLENTIENALKVIDADLYVVLTGCSPEIVGDNVEEVVKKFSEEGKPVVVAPTPGFKGNNYLGHEWILDSLIEQYLTKSDIKIKGLVNIWADVPIQDPFWAGNYRELEDLVSQLGLIPNTIFGFERGLDNLKKVPQAEFNLLVSPWIGLGNVKLLEEKFGTPYLHYPHLPIGAIETSKFLLKVGEYAKLDKALVEKVIRDNEKEYYYHIERFASSIAENRISTKRFAIVGDAQYTLSITKFLTNDLGYIPLKQYITDDTPLKYRERIKEDFKDLNDGIEAEVIFESDGYTIQESIKNDDYYDYPVIIGSFWEKSLADSIKGLFISVAWPIRDRAVINGTFVGYSGGLRLIEDILTQQYDKQLS